MDMNGWSYPLGNNVRRKFSKRALCYSPIINQTDPVWTSQVDMVTNHLFKQQPTVPRLVENLRARIQPAESILGTGIPPPCRLG